MRSVIRTSLLVVTALSVTACSSMSEVVIGSRHYSSYRPYDPCIRCGESWIVIPNQNMAAITQSRQMPGFTEKDYQKARQKMDQTR